MGKNITRNLKISLPGAAVLGGLVTLINPGEKPLIGWLGSTFMSFLFLFGIIAIFKKLHSPKKVQIITLVNFLLRVAVGIALFLLLPVFGYDEEPPQAGYLYLDAYHRDTDAWQIASSDIPIFAGFADEFTSDQYGGMLTLSAVIYRLLSPDAHRPIMILLFTAFISSLGIPFYWQVIQQKFNPKIAYLATWIVALYPESIVLGGSQMREPLIIGLCGILLWGLEYRKSDQRAGQLILIGSFVVLTVISTRYAVAILFLLLLWSWADLAARKDTKKQKILAYLFPALIAIIGIGISWNWLVDTSRWDLYLMESSSGRVQYELENFGGRFRIPFLATYGLLQPVLPASIAYPGILIMRVIAIFRSLGWYLIAPLLLLVPFFTSKEENKQTRRILITSTIFVFFWILLSSLRAGGDQWDNPRYRTAILPWIALIVSWTFIYLKERKSPWIKRIYLVLTVFCLFFLQWYLSRYYKLWSRLPFSQMIVVLSATLTILIAGFIIYDRVKGVKKKG